MPSQLTPREQQVVRLASLGCTREEIAKILSLTMATADCHKALAMGRLGTDKTVLLTRLAIKRKVTSMTDKLTPTEKPPDAGRTSDGRCPIAPCLVLSRCADRIREVEIAIRAEFDARND